MILKLLDYARDIVEFDIGDIEDIAIIMIEVITGDEIARVTYKDGSIEKFDSCERLRWSDFYDGEYVIYNIFDDTNRLDDPKFVNRKNTYSYMYDMWNEDEEES